MQFQKRKYNKRAPGGLEVTAAWQLLSHGLMMLSYCCMRCLQTPRTHSDMMA